MLLPLLSLLLSLPLSLPLPLLLLRIPARVFSSPTKGDAGLGLVSGVSLGVRGPFNRHDKPPAGPSGASPGGGISSGSGEELELL